MVKFAWMLFVFVAVTLSVTGAIVYFTNLHGLIALGLGAIAGLWGGSKA